MNSFLKGQILAEIRNPENKIKRHEHASGEQIAVFGPTDHILFDVFNGPDKHSFKVGGEEVHVDDKDFEEIILELHICYASDVESAAFKEKKPKVSSDIFRNKKQK